MLTDIGLIDSLRTQVFDNAGDLQSYAVLDGALNPGLLPEMERHDVEHCCLWLGALEPDMQEIAPYLVKLKRDCGFSDYLIRDGYGARWGIYLHSAASLLDLRSHFRRLTIVTLPDGRSVYFRFYDPAVLPTVLSTASRDQHRALYGPVETYLCEVPQAQWASVKDRRFTLHCRPGGGDAQASPVGRDPALS